MTKKEWEAERSKVISGICIVDLKITCLLSWEEYVCNEICEACIAKARGW